MIPNMSEKLRYAGIRMDAEEWMLRTIIYSSSITLIVFIITYFAYELLLAIIVGLLSFTSAMLTRYFLVELKIENRRREVEKILPDLLRVIAANIGSGLTPIVALRSAARPEFGAISKELKYITARSMSTDSMDEIIHEIQQSIRSDLLDRVLMVFTNSLRSGGDLVRALEMSANDIQRIYELHDTLVAQTSMYTTFLLFGILITMPFLLAVSINVMELMGSISSAHQLSYVSSYMNIGFPTISTETTVLISIIVLFGTSLTASIALSIIRTGRRIEGIKYFPILLFCSLIVFFLSKEVIVPFIVGILG